MKRRRVQRVVALGAAFVLAFVLLDQLGIRRLSGRDFPVKTPLGHELAAHVAILASPQWGGRVPGTAGNAAAADYLVRTLERQGYAPHPSVGSFRMPVGGGLGDNVIGHLEGDGRAQGAVVIGTHFDHLGGTETPGKMLLGADDNASSIAVVLGMLPVLRQRPRKHPIVIAFFNTEESPYFGTPRQGSRRFASALGLRAGDVHLAIVMDLVGGVVWRTTANTIYACGAEKTPGLAALIAEEPPSELDVRRLGIHLVENIPGMQPQAFSDYDVFRQKRIPFLFVTSGRTPRYHHPSDLPDTVHYDRMARTTGWLSALVARVDRAERFTFDPEGLDLRSDAATLKPLIEAAARPWSWIPGTGPITALRLVQDRARVRAIAEKDDAFSPEDALSLGRASFRMQCLLYAYPVCFTL